LFPLWLESERTRQEKTASKTEDAACSMGDDMMDNQPILRFISRFKGSADVFLHGCCYWFAHILENQFLLKQKEKPKIKYEPVEGHFITRIRGRLYDIRGDVTELYEDKNLYDMERLLKDDPKLYFRLMRDCRDFEEMEDNADDQGAD